MPPEPPLDRPPEMDEAIPESEVRRVTRRSLVAGALGLGGALVAARPAAAVTPPSSDGRQSGHDDATGPPSGQAAPRRTSRVVWGASTTEPVAALTFDDGPTTAWTTGFLEIIEAFSVPATFFVVGSQAEEHPELVRRVAARHEVGSHTWSHADLTQATARQCREELERADEVIRRLTGRRPTLFRPPYGHLPGRVLAMAAELGYDVALWTIALRELALDAAGNAAWVLDLLQPGTVVLGHDAGGPQRAVGLAALPGIIRGAQRRGVRFVTMSELIALEQGRG